MKPITSLRPAPTLHAYSSYGWLRGFSIIPSWGARIEDAWWFYDPQRMREEVQLATQVHANCIRLWIEFTAWMRDPEAVTAHFMDAVAAIDEVGLKVMPCLFNRWHDRDYDYGGTYTENLFYNWEPQMAYVRALVTPLATDERVLAWDLCNEPQAYDLNTAVNQQEYKWLEQIAATVRGCGAQAPIIIGTMTGSTIDLFEPLVDVLCAHPYGHDEAWLNRQIAEFQAQGAHHGKPVLVNETIPGSLDDATRANVTRFYTEALSRADMGWMGWALREGQAISTRRDRHDANGINGEGFHPFFTRSGSLREGLDFLTEPPAFRAPWLDVPASCQ